jgi:ubiquinone/menaquinone biosynthesis C-methylase UbiE
MKTRQTTKWIAEGPLFGPSGDSTAAAAAGSMRRMRTFRVAAAATGAGFVAARVAGLRPGRGVVALLGTAPALRARVKKGYWKVVYNASSGRRDPGTAFMNYGYAPLEGADGQLAGADVPEDDRYGLQLYGRVAGAVDLAGKDVLEVGCGRGGGAAFVFERFGPRSMTGIDLAKTAIARAQEDHGRPGLTFATGDAENLPFPDASFDAVINVESSHCYPDVARFLDEVHRVLRPGGHLLLADFRHTTTDGDDDTWDPEDDNLPKFRAQLEASPFETVEEEDITPNVVRALDLDSDTRRARVESRVPKPFQAQALKLAGVVGSPIYDAYAQGRMTYLRYVLRKPEGAGID